MHWELESKTCEELEQSREHLRACDIIRDCELFNQMRGQPALEAVVHVT